MGFLEKMTQKYFVFSDREKRQKEISKTLEHLKTSPEKKPIVIGVSHSSLIFSEYIPIIDALKARGIKTIGMEIDPIAIKLMKKLGKLIKENEKLAKEHKQVLQEREKLLRKLGWGKTRIKLHMLKIRASHLYQRLKVSKAKTSAGFFDQLFTYAKKQGIKVIPIDWEGRSEVARRLARRRLRRLRTTDKLQVAGALGDVHLIEQIHRNGLNAENCAVICGNTHAIAIARYMPEFQYLRATGYNSSMDVESNRHSRRIVEKRLARKKLLPKTRPR